ncbi:MAG: ribonuclease P [Candidatus Bathyarchaeota archaeon]|uniref:ribonuclease P protein component 4 n=1 Tax=Candidatus Bathycorpusculum sp. TaxID=2994959 RepID=UPI00283A6164|nr:ribonuclease P [Candidatus Termiticorpusculum sp.]MCL2257469.1 ribonuclease P [Candidatus Termiticorpusculum sp.]MCL2292414.1 ribonuclease P [Candidatus Termiticorpusculum sp.]
MKNTVKPLSVKQIAEQRVNTLFTQAESIVKINPQLAVEYIKTAQKVAMSARFPLPPKYKRRICKHCNTLLISGFNCRARIQQKREPHVVVTCLNCGYHLRILIRKKKENAKIE